MEIGLNAGGLGAAAFGQPPSSAQHGVVRKGLARKADRAMLQRAGHLVYNHTRDHVSLDAVSDAGFRSQVRRGPAPTRSPKLLRPPYGAGSFSTRTITQAAALGYSLCRWTTDTSDWKGRTPLQMYSVVRNGDGSTPPVGPGGVILMHATHYSAKRFQAVLNAVRDRHLTADPLPARR